MELSAEAYSQLTVDDYGRDVLHDFMLEPAAIDVALKTNSWLLSVLPDEGLPLRSRQIPFSDI